MRQGYTCEELTDAELNMTKDGETSNGAMLEEICTIRRKMGLVVTMYLPGHRGMVANEYADAVAKTHAQRDVDEDITRNIAKMIKTRPCIYEHDDGRGMCTRPLYTTARRGVGDQPNMFISHGYFKARRAA